MIRWVKLFLENSRRIRLFFFNYKNVFSYYIGEKRGGRIFDREVKLKN